MDLRRKAEAWEKRAEKNRRAQLAEARRWRPDARFFRQPTPTQRETLRRMWRDDGARAVEYARKNCLDLNKLVLAFSREPSKLTP